MAGKVTIKEANRKLLKILKPYVPSIRAIYFYALMEGFIELAVPLGIQSIVNFIMAQTFSTSLWVLIFFVVLGVLISGILKVTQMKIIENVQQDLFVSYGYKYTNHIPKIDLKHLEQNYLPAVSNKFLDVVILQKGLSKILLDIPIASIQITFGLILLSAYSSVFLAFGAVLVILLYLIVYFSSTKGLNTSVAESSYKYNVSNWLQELSRLNKTFKLNDFNNLHTRKTDNNLVGYVNARTAHFKILLTQYWSLIVFKVLITITMLVAGAYLLIENRINLGQFVAAEIVILAVMNSVEKFLLSLDKVYDILTSAEKLNEVLDMPSSTEGTANVSDKQPITVGFNDVSINFAHAQPLQNVTLNLAGGTFTTIVGGSGSGKSLLTKLLNGLQTFYTGDVLINNLPIRNYNNLSLQENIATSLSETEIFSGTLLENITVGNPNVNLDRIIELSSLLKFSSLFTKYDNGTDFKLTIDDKILSKEDKKKVLLLRTLCPSVKMYILEEPYQYLAVEEAQAVNNYLHSIKNTATIICISNNRKYIDNSDYCVVMSKGKLIACDKPNSIKNLINEYLND